MPERIDKAASYNTLLNEKPIADSRNPNERIPAEYSPKTSYLESLTHDNRGSCVILGDNNLDLTE